MGSISPAALWTDIPVQHEHRGAEGLAQPTHSPSVWDFIASVREELDGNVGGCRY